MQKDIVKYKNLKHVIFRVSSKRRTKFVPNTSDPVWDQTLEYMVPFHELYSHYLEFTVWNYDRLNDNNALGKLVISLSGGFN